MNTSENKMQRARIQAANHIDKIVLIIEDHPLYAQALADILPQGYRALFAANASAMRKIIQREAVEIALLDLDLGDGGNGMELIEELVRAQVKPIINSGTAKLGQAAACIRLGALAYISKAEGAQAMRNAICKVASGENAISPSMEKENHNLPEMSEREISVLHRLVENPDITTAELMNEEHLCDGRVRKIVSTLLKKLDVKNKKREHIAARAAELGYYPGIQISPMARKKYDRRLF